MLPFQLDYPRPRHTYTSVSNVVFCVLFPLKNIKGQHFIQAHAYLSASVTGEHIYLILNSSVLNETIFGEVLFSI